VHFGEVLRRAMADREMNRSRVTSPRGAVLSGLTAKPPKMRGMLPLAA
jgi:hypothetical protein